MAARRVSVKTMKLLVLKMFSTGTMAILRSSVTTVSQKIRTLLSGTSYGRKAFKRASKTRR